MQYFETELSVDVHDVDYNGVARGAALMKYIQSAAQSQLTANGLSYDELKSMNKAFILSKIKLEFTSTVRAYDRLKAMTFAANSRGYSFLRCYQLQKNGETIGKGASVWALVDTQTHALVKVNDFDLGLQTYDSLDIPMNRIVIPSGIEPVGTYTVNYADTDQNGHMNNTRYPDMYSNFLPLNGRRIREITIFYSAEAPMGERLTVERAVADGVYYFRTLREDGRVNTEAEIKLCEI